MSASGEHIWKINKRKPGFFSQEAEMSRQEDIALTAVRKSTLRSLKEKRHRVLLRLNVIMKLQFARLKFSMMKTRSVLRQSMPLQIMPAQKKPANVQKLKSPGKNLPSKLQKNTVLLPLQKRLPAQLFRESVPVFLLRQLPVLKLLQSAMQ